MHKQRKRKVIILSGCGSELGIGKCSYTLRLSNESTTF
jgi:hypothetical protein